MALSSAVHPYDGVFPQHEPYGTGVGVMPGRVAWVYDPDSVEWDDSGYWWELSHFDETAVQDMVDESIASLGRAVFRSRLRQKTKREGFNSFRFALFCVLPILFCLSDRNRLYFPEILPIILLYPGREARQSIFYGRAGLS